MGLRSQLILQYSQKGLTKLIEEMQSDHQVKKGDRFNVDGITYEIGVAKGGDDFIEFEISSKIPQDDLSDKHDLDHYFKAVKENLKTKGHGHHSIDMENIVRNTDKDKEKKRDYVKLNYHYKFDELCDEKKLLLEAEEIKNNPSKRKIPDMPGITTLAGKLFLLNITDNIFKEGKTNIQDLMVANKIARAKIKS